jgi:4-methyl-5(b-hydroxyethyl)-thiazole monophosphate biosynthesis
MVYIFLADGFEEIEGLTVADVLRRMKIDVKTVSVTGNRLIHGSHGIDLYADSLFENENFDAGRFKEIQALVLPGGLGGGKGTNMLMAHVGLKKLLAAFSSVNGLICAVCAAPSVLGALGLLKGRKAICYPGFEDRLTGAEVTEKNVVEDGNIITSRGMGTSIEFALAIGAKIIGREAADDMADKIQFTYPLGM